MNLFLRFLILLLKIRNLPLQEFTQASRLRFRVMPTDSDYFQHHMTNSRFPSFMDLGRIHWMAQAGLYQPMREKGWGVVVSASQITYLGMIRWGKPFQLESRPVCWDDKYLYLEQCFIADGKVRAVGLAKLVFVGKQGSIPLQDILTAAGIKLEPSECPANIKDWQQALSHRY